ncbi:hypothetical protein [Rathayibacter rathayi]|uniref:hypothetical protein n=1 Tax=Rathayibacter rathayi TaxID=33887 RepID=UPI0015E201D8|nr:hypothetical protein [Rathayibacter rathayi]
MSGFINEPPSVRVVRRRVAALPIASLSGWAAAVSAARNWSVLSMAFALVPASGSVTASDWTASASRRAAPSLTAFVSVDASFARSSAVLCSSAVDIVSSTVGEVVFATGDVETPEVRSIEREDAAACAVVLSVVEAAATAARPVASRIPSEMDTRLSASPTSEFAAISASPMVDAYFDVVCCAVVRSDSAV